MFILSIIAVAISALIFFYLMAERMLPEASERVNAQACKISKILCLQSIDMAEVKIERIIYASVCAGGVACFAAVPLWGLKLLLAPFFMWIGWKVPLWTARYMLARRRKAFESQFVDGLTLIANAIKAGLGLQQALEMASFEMPRPFGEELSHVLADVRIGRTLEEALEGLVTRLDQDDVKLVVRSICILRETGGNIIETFQTITSTVRERQKVHGKITVLTTQGVVQGVIIFCMPFALAGALYIMAPDYIMPLFRKPLGLVLIFAALMLQTVGALLIKKIVMIRI